MMKEVGGKRSATTDLNHDNWDQEEATEEAGTFRQASKEQLKDRVIKKAKRRGAGANVRSTNLRSSRSSFEEFFLQEGSSNVFSSFGAFGSAKPAAAAGAFDFLKKLPQQSQPEADDPPAATKVEKKTVGFEGTPFAASKNTNKWTSE